MNYKKTLAILLVLAFVTGTVSVLQPQAAAADPVKMKTYALSDAIPNRVGLGQEVLLKCGITEALASQAYGWTGITITIEKPDGTTEKIGPLTTDSTGSTFRSYVPNQIGTYNVTTNFPEQEMPVDTRSMERGGTIVKGTIMLASTKSSQFVVTEEPTAQYPGHALPTEYWSRPIDPQLREWAIISGNWVQRPDNALALYNNDAPETAHVLWANQITTGGLTGGLITDVPAASQSGDAYEGLFSNAVVLNGILYYNTCPQGTYGALGVQGIQAIDLHTGEKLWFKNDTFLSFGQVLYWNSYNVDGVYTYLWSVSGSTYNAYDPVDGSWAFSFTNVPGGTRVFGPSGEILIYQIDYRNNRMTLWNSTLAGLQSAIVGQPSYGSWASNVMLKKIVSNSSKCYSWNVTIPTGLSASGTKIYNEDRIVGIFFNQTKVRVWALNLEGLNSESTSTTKIFDEWWNPPSEWYDGSNILFFTGASNNVDKGVIAVWDKELTTHYGFSVETGKHLWATESEHYLDAYGWGSMEHTWYFAYDHLYSVGVGGILYAFDLSTGKTDWTYDLNDAYGEPVTGQNWWGWITLIADDKVYVGHLEHSAENPIPRGAPQICINASDGTEIWRVNGMFRNTRWGGNGVIGDSIIATMDTYDQRVYAIGKGPTVTTAEAPKAGIPLGSSLVISGSVLDISPGTATTEMKLRFPNGVAAVSDESQSQWMLHVYKQFERPTNLTGVDVTIDVVDANGNYRNIGTATADSNGYYSLQWTPDISGKYSVFVTFAGSRAYYGSFSQTSFAVDDVASTPTAQPERETPISEQYFLPAIVGLFIFVAVIGAVIILMLRKRP